MDLLSNPNSTIFKAYNYLLNFCFYLCLCAWLLVCMCTICVQVSTEAKEDIELPETGTGSCELPEVGSGKQTIILCKSTML